MPWVEELLTAPVRAEGRGVLSALPPDADGAGRFEGVYGGIYDRVIQSDTARRFGSLLYGDIGPVADLDGLVVRVATQTQPVSGDRPPVLLDVPAGGGTLLPRLWRRGYRGRVLAADLGAAMLDRAAGVAERVPLDVELLRCDAQALPLHDAAVDAAVSLNGLHVLPDPRAFLSELGRVIRPHGRLWLVTLVSGGARRSDLVIRAGELAGILPGPPPSRVTLLRWMDEAGFLVGAGGVIGGGIVGISATRR